MVGVVVATGSQRHWSGIEASMISQLLEVNLKPTYVLRKVSISEMPSDYATRLFGHWVSCW